VESAFIKPVTTKRAIEARNKIRHHGFLYENRLAKQDGGKQSKVLLFFAINLDI
jgi:hypothetical protein